MDINEAKILDYVENNLSTKEKEAIDKEILSNSQLKKKVDDIRDAIKISSMAYEQEKELDKIDFSSLKSKIDKEVDNEYQAITGLKKKSKSSVVVYLKDKLSFKIGITQISAVAATFVIGYFSATSISYLGLDNKNQYAWEPSKNSYRSVNKDEKEEIAYWAIKELGVELNIQSRSPEGKLKPIKINEKISIKNIVIIQVRSDINDLVLKYSDNDDKGFIIIPKGEVIEPILLEYKSVGKKVISIFALDDENTFSVKFNYDVIN